MASPSVTHKPEVLMKLKHLFSVFTLMGVMLSTTSKADTNFLTIRSLFNIKNSFCTIKTNDVVGMDNRDSAFYGAGGGISSTNSLLFLKNGQNKISIEIGSLRWFSNESMSDEERSKFNPLSSCRLDLVSDKMGTKTTLSTINIRVNKVGVPESAPSSNPITRHKIKAEQAVSGHINPDYFEPNYYPAGMEVYSFEQTITLNGIPVWPWLNATAYNGSTEQLNLLKQAYDELSTILKSKDREKLKESHKLALKSWAIATGDTPDEILYSQYSKNEFEGGELNIIPIQWDDYEVRSMNGGLIVQMYNKSNPTYSPLTYYYKDENGAESMGSIAPMFSLIDGKFVVVI